MLIYYNDIIMNQASRSIFCADAFRSRHDSALFQKAGTTSLRTGSLSFILALGHLLSFFLPDCHAALCLSPVSTTDEE